MGISLGKIRGESVYDRVEVKDVKENRIVEELDEKISRQRNPKYDQYGHRWKRVFTDEESGLLHDMNARVGALQTWKYAIRVRLQQYRETKDRKYLDEIKGLELREKIYRTRREFYELKAKFEELTKEA